MAQNTGYSLRYQKSFPERMGHYQQFIKTILAEVDKETSFCKKQSRILEGITYLKNQYHTLARRPNFLPWNLPFGKGHRPKVQSRVNYLSTIQNQLFDQCRRQELRTEKQYQLHIKQMQLQLNKQIQIHRINKQAQVAANIQQDNRNSRSRNKKPQDS